MSRLISKKLFLRNATVSHSFFSSPTVFLRHRSSKQHQSQLLEVDLCGEYDVTLKLFDQLIQRILVMKSTPDWLPFVPGSSFWVPPRTTPSSNAGDFVHNLSDEQYFSLVTRQGCPASKFFVQELELARGEDTGMELNIPEGMEDTVKTNVPTIPGSVAHSEDEEG